MRPRENLSLLYNDTCTTLDTRTYAVLDKQKELVQYAKTIAFIRESDPTTILEDVVSSSAIVTCDVYSACVKKYREIQGYLAQLLSFRQRFDEAFNQASTIDSMQKKFNKLWQEYDRIHEAMTIAMQSFKEELSYFETPASTQAKPDYYDWKMREECEKQDLVFLCRAVVRYMKIAAKRRHIEGFPCIETSVLEGDKPEDDRERVRFLQAVYGWAKQKLDALVTAPVVDLQCHPTMTCLSDLSKATHPDPSQRQVAYQTVRLLNNQNQPYGYGLYQDDPIPPRVSSSILDRFEKKGAYFCGLVMEGCGVLMITTGVLLLPVGIPLILIGALCLLGGAVMAVANAGRNALVDVVEQDEIDPEPQKTGSTTGLMLNTLSQSFKQFGKMVGISKQPQPVISPPMPLVSRGGGVPDCHHVFNKKQVKPRVDAGVSDAPGMRFDK